jgi:putative membrane protein
MKMLLQFIATTITIYLAAKLVPGIHLSNLQTALLFSLVLGILNILVKPLILLLTLPVNIMTLGLFTIIINAFMLILTAAFVSGVQIDSFLSAILFSLAISVIGWFLNLLL